MPREPKRVRDWEHVLFATMLLGFVVWYLATATAASPTFSNLMLIAPVGAVAIVLIVFIVLAEVFGRSSAATIGPSGQLEKSSPAAQERFRSGAVGTIVALIVLFGLFVVAIPYVGFDIATFAFTLATLWLLGERGIVFSLSIALGTAAVLSIAALTLLTFPMPLTVARTLWGAL
jgi:putative tricarboxylic transport membrane protein